MVSKKVRKAGAREEEEAAGLMVVMQEAFAGIRVVKTHAREDFEAAAFQRGESPDHASTSCAGGKPWS